MSLDSAIFGSSPDAEACETLLVWKACAAALVTLSLPRNYEGRTVKQGPTIGHFPFLRPSRIFCEARILDLTFFLHGPERYRWLNSVRVTRRMQKRSRLAHGVSKLACGTCTGYHTPYPMPRSPSPRPGRRIASLRQHAASSCPILSRTMRPVTHQSINE